MPRRSSRPSAYSKPSPSSYGAPASSRSSGGIQVTTTSIAILAGVFILGIGIGIGFSSATNADPENVASREAIDRSAPNAELCAQFGASSVVMDMRVFLTLNPFNVYVAQPEMQPGCVLRSNNWSLLEQRGLISSQQVRDCKNRMNTFGFVGPLEGSPKIDCIYQNDAAENLFLKKGGDDTPPETNRF
ncbi:MAG: DUF3172 domain-containing protein [Cyanobacteria bacterium P01_H01_bin.121]